MRHRALWTVPILLALWGAWHLLAPSPNASVSLSLPAPVITASAPTSAPPSPPSTALDRSAPVRLLIPAIGLRAFVDPIDLRRDGTLGTPSYQTPNRAAWYRGGPSPGERGPAVILGHVDTKTSVAVFYYLRKLRPADLVGVQRQDGRMAVFAIDRLEQVAKNAFPTAKVYGSTSDAQIRLVTCAGRFDAKTGEYTDNLVVYGHLVSVRPPGTDQTRLVG